MSINEALENKELNGAGILAFIAAILLNLLNGALLKTVTNSKIPQMNYNDILVIILAILGGIYTVVRIMNERLKYISKKKQMAIEDLVDEKIRNRMNQPKEDEPSKDS